MTQTDGRSPATIERFSGFADRYDEVRPNPPEALPDALAHYGLPAIPACVIDLGSGTGLSTRFWVGRARTIIGVEPSRDMRVEAERLAGREVAVPPGCAPAPSYRDGTAAETGLPDACADLVVCMQSLHWMEPRSTFAEVRRVLKPGGLFAACDYDWPPLAGNWRVEHAWLECAQRVARLEKLRPLEYQPPRWDKSGHLARLTASGHFRFVREVVLHQRDHGTAARLLGLMRSQGGVMDLLKDGHAPAALGLDAFERMATAELGNAPQPWLWCARVRLAIA